MLSRLLSYRPGHGTVVGYIALFIALGGTSYGLATGSIGSREVKNNSIRSKDIRNNNIRSKDVRDFSLLAKDFKPQQLPAGERGATGPRGATGAQGPAGAAKAYGTVSAAGVASRTRNVISVTKSAGFAATYCIDTAVSVQNVVATIQTGGSGVSAGVSYGTFGDCPAATDVTVRTVNEAGLLTDAPFTFLVN